MRCGLVALTLSGVLSAVPLSVGQRSRGTSVATSGLILGQVVDAATNQGVRNAIVSLGGRQLNMTTRDGRFVFRNVPAGAYSITANKFGYLTGSAGVRRLGEEPSAVQIYPGERRGDILVRLWKYGAISGMVIDEAGEPLAGIRVIAIAREGASGTTSAGPLLGGTTDDRGIYRIARLRPGNYFVAMLPSEVSVPADVMRQYDDELMTPAAIRSGGISELLSNFGPLPGRGDSSSRQLGNMLQSMVSDAPTPPMSDDSRVMTYPAVFYPSARSIASAVAVAVGAAREVTGIHLRVSPVATVRVSGAVIGPTGPASLLPVRLVAAGSEAVGPIAETAKTITGLGGVFAFPSVPAGEYWIQVLQGPPGVASIQEFDAASFNPRTKAAETAPETLWANVPVTVGDEDISDLDVVLKQGLKVAGRITFEGTSAKPETLQQSRFTFFLEPVDGPGSTDMPIMGRADARGEFVVTRVPGGHYRLTAATPIGPWTLAGIQIGGREVDELPLELDDSDISGLVVTYTDRPASIAGSVQQSGRSLDDACVIVFPAESERRARAGRNSRRLRISQLAESGVYRIADLPRGTYYVAAVQGITEDWRDQAFLERLSGSARYVRLGQGEQVTVDLRLRDLGR